MQQFREGSLSELRQVTFHIEGVGAALARLSWVVEAGLLEHRVKSSCLRCRFAAATDHHLPVLPGLFVPEAFRVAVRWSARGARR